MISKTRPIVERFEPVAPTKQDVPFVDLMGLDISKFDNGPEARAVLAEKVREAMTTQGFFYMTNHGIDENDIARQVDIGHHIMKNTPLEEKRELQAPMIEEGSYHGFKPRGHWEWTEGVRDKVENFNVNRDMTRRKQPSAMQPYMAEIQEFIDTCHKDILVKVLRLFAIALKLDDEEYFVKLHSYAKHDESWFRYMKYFDEYSPAEKEKTQGLWLGGHQDFTSLSMLFSQPMASLQCRDFKTDEWKYIRYYPGSIIVNGGEIMQWFTGNYFKAAIHRVFEPPSDQRNHERCSLFYFVVPNDDVVINTLLEESLVLREAGVEMAHLPENAPTSKEWSNNRIRVTGRNLVFKGKKENTVVEQVGKVTTKWFR